MALTPTKNKSETFIRRQCVTPTAKRVLYEHVFDFNGKTLYRSLSCDQMISTHPENSKEVLSTTKVSAFACQLNKEHKKRKQKMESGVKQKMESSFRSRLTQALYWMVTVGVIGLTSVSYYKERIDSLPWSGRNVKSSLKPLVGQDVAVDIISQAVDFSLTFEKPTFLLFTGGVGVGKSAAASYLINSFPVKDNVLYIPASMSPKTDFISFLEKKGQSLVVLDDVNAQNFLSTIDIVRPFLNLGQRLSKNVFLVLIFTHRTDIESKEMMKTLSELNYVHVPFVPLTRKAIEHCFLRIIEEWNIRISQSDLADLVEEQMQVIQEVGGTPGCKQVESKLLPYMKFS